MKDLITLFKVRLWDSSASPVFPDRSLLTTDFCPRRRSVGSRQHFRQILHLAPLHMPVPTPKISSSGLHHHGNDNRLHCLHHHQFFHHLSPLLIFLGQVAKRSMWKPGSSLYDWRHLQPHPRRDSRRATNAHVVGSPDGEREESGFDWGIWTRRRVCSAQPNLNLGCGFQAILTLSPPTKQNLHHHNPSHQISKRPRPAQYHIQHCARGAVHTPGANAWHHQRLPASDPARHN